MLYPISTVHGQIQQHNVETLKQEQSNRILNCERTVNHFSSPPAEDTFIGTGQAGGGLHAPVRLNAVKGVLVAASPPTQHRLTEKARKCARDVEIPWEKSSFAQKTGHATWKLIQQSELTLVHRHNFTPEWLPMSLYPGEKSRWNRHDPWLDSKGTGLFVTQKPNCFWDGVTMTDLTIQEMLGCLFSSWNQQKTIPHKDLIYQEVSPTTLTGMIRQHGSLGFYTNLYIRAKFHKATLTPSRPLLKLLHCTPSMVILPLIRRFVLCG